MPTPLGQFLNSASPFAQYLTQAGDGTGAINANGNYAGGATTWYIQPPANQTILISALQVQITDTGIINGLNYGGLATLTNGINFRSVINAAPSQLTVGNNVFTNGQLAAISSKFEFHSLGANAFIITAQIGFFSQLGVPVVLEGRFNDRIEVVLNDNFTGLDAHRFVVFGGVLK